MKYRCLSIIFLVFIFAVTTQQAAFSGELSRNTHYLTNQAPLAPKMFTELPLGAIKPEGWLLVQLEDMAHGMTGHLDEMYPEVVGPRNGWLGGDGDGWERGPYWIDGLLPLAYILDDPVLIGKAKPWIEWTLNNQADDGYIGPVPFATPPEEEAGLQRGKRRDWWPKMVMLKILQQYYMATGDERVIDTLTRYFRYQLSELPKTPLDHWSFWGNRRGGDNLLVVYWLYNITKDDFLLELGELLHEQTHPYTDIFLERGDIELHLHQTSEKGGVPFHCVNLAQGIKEPVIYYQAHPEQRYLQAVHKGFSDIERFHGQPHGLFGGDEGLHGRRLTQGSELCTAVEMMYSLETMLEITGDTAFADRLEKIAFNVLPAQISDDCMTRQYFQQANQVMCTIARRNFFNNEDDRNVFGILSGYPCCTCNMHQGWPKFTQHLWMASHDNGLAALVYAPSRATVKVADGQEITVTQKTAYPFDDTVLFQFSISRPADFPLYLRIPGWCQNAVITINGGETITGLHAGELKRIDRTWKNGDSVELKLPGTFQVHRGYENSVSIERGPLLYVLKIEEQWKTVDERKDVREVRPKSPWNYGLFEDDLTNAGSHIAVIERQSAPDRPWNPENAPVTLKMRGVRLHGWQLYNDMAGPIPWSPQAYDTGTPEEITLIPYGCSTLRISAFPAVRTPRNR